MVNTLFISTTIIIVLENKNSIMVLHPDCQAGNSSPAHFIDCETLGKLFILFSLL